ncbi:uncharacterized protein METZ01_LOCUS245496, partial [marine metagenome]
VKTFIIIGVVLVIAFSQPLTPPDAIKKPYEM